MEKKITKNEIQFLRSLQNKKYRDLYKKFIIEGLEAIEQARRAKHEVIVYSSNLQLKANKYLDYESVRKILNSVNPPEVFGLVNYLNSKEIIGDVVALDNIQDPGNLGTIIRNCVSFGIKNIIVNGVNIYNDKVLRSTKGAIFNINIIQTHNLVHEIEKLKDTHQIVGTLLDRSAKSLIDFSPRQNYVLVFGNEAKGICKQVQDLLDERIYIPINFESLNVAICNGIALYELRARRGKYGN